MHAGYKTNVGWTTFCKIGSSEVWYTRCWKTILWVMYLLNSSHIFWHWRRIQIWLQPFGDAQVHLFFVKTTLSGMMIGSQSTMDHYTAGSDNLDHAWVRVLAQLPLFSVFAICRVHRKGEGVIRGHQRWNSLYNDAVDLINANEIALWCVLDIKLFRGCMDRTHDVWYWHVCRHARYYQGDPCRNDGRYSI